MSDVRVRAADRDASRDALRSWRVDRLGPVVVCDDAAMLARPTRDMLAVARTPEGFLRGRARIARAGVLEYGDDTGTWGEYRSVEELRKAAPTFGLVLLTDDHPAEFVSSENAREVFAGLLADDVTVERGTDGVDYLVGTITIADAEAIAVVEGGKRELSIGFSAMVVESPGVFDGVPYKFVQTEIEGNHLSIVDRGRAGPEVKVPIGDRRDAFAAVRGAPVATRHLDQRTDSTMDPVTIEIAGVAYQVDPAVAAHIAGLESQITAMQATAAEAAAKAPAPAPAPAPAAAPPAPVGDAATVGRLTAERDAAVARAAGLEATFAERVAARVALVSSAAEVVDELDASRLSDDGVRAAVAAAVFPALKSTIADRLAAADKGDAGARGYLLAMYDTARAAASDTPSIGDRLDHARATTRKTGTDADIAAVLKLESDSNARRTGRKA